MLEAKKVLFFYCCFIFFLLDCNAQKEAYNWYFGNKAAINFSSGQPSSMDNSEMLAYNGCASISDSSGNLLFYSNGEKVWNRNHSVMPNGINLNGYNGATQSALVVPSPQSNGIYFLFTIGMYLGTGDNLGCFYSVIDMSYDNGLGDIIPNQKNIFLPESDSATDVIMAIAHANQKAFWIIIRDFSSVNSFKSYLLDENGLQQNPISSACLKNLAPNASRGTSKVSPDGKYYLFGGQGGSPQNPRQNELYRFNNSTGILSPVFSFSPDAISLVSTFGAEFSANSDYLYLSTSHITWPMIWHSSVRQFDLSKLNGVNEFETSHIVLYDEIIEHGFKQMQIGPDGKIYIAQAANTSNQYLSCINFPSEAGLACNFEKNSVVLSSGNSIDGLPTFIQSYFVKFSWLENCLGDSTHFSSWFLPEPESIQWDFGDPGSGSNNFSNLLNPAHQFSGQGNFTVSAIATYPNGRTESYVREVWITPYPVFELGEDQTICQGDEVTLSSGVMLAQCLWNTGATTPSITVSYPGEYWLRVENNNGCIFKDTVSVYLFTEPSLDTTNLIISPTTCGNSIGAITGVNIIGGTPPYNAFWLNSIGDTIGTTNNLYNLGVENYYLWVTDQSGCNILVASIDIQNFDHNLIITGVDPKETWCSLPLGELEVQVESGLSDRLFYSIDNWATYQTNGSFTGLLPNTPYYVKVKDSLDCEAVYAGNPVYIQDNPGPQAAASSEPATGSNPNGSITLTATGFGNLTYSLNGGTPQSSGEFTGLIAGTYTWRVEDENGCFTEGSIEVGQEAGFIISAIAGNSAVCLGNAPVAPLLIENFTGVQAFTATLEYDATLVNCEGFRPGSVHPQLEANLIAEVYPASQRIVVTWSGISPLTLMGTVTVLDLVFSATQAGNSFLTWDQAPAATWFTGEYGSIEPEFEIGQIQVNHPPVLAQLFPENVCEGELAWITAPGSGNEPLTYQWTLPDGSTSQNSSLMFYDASTTHSGQYRVKVSDALGCSDSTMLTLQVTPNPRDWFLQDTILFENQYLLAGPAGYASYLWSTGDTMPEITVNTEGLYTLQLTTHNLCAGADSTYLKMLEAESPFLVPNAFTPNNDGLNDTFRPVVDYERVRMFNMVIYNRWGQLIFETTNPAEGWDGKDAPAGVYSWVISYSDMMGKVVKMRGGVTLVR